MRGSNYGLCRNNYFVFYRPVMAADAWLRLAGEQTNVIS